MSDAPFTPAQEARIRELIRAVEAEDAAEAAADKARAAAIWYEANRPRVEALRKTWWLRRISDANARLAAAGEPLLPSPDAAWAWPELADWLRRQGFAPGSPEPVRFDAGRW